MLDRPLPPTRANVAAASGEQVALVDCLECANGVYLPPGICSCCGAPAPAYVARLMSALGKKRAAA